jgi:hypothetical protein
MHSRDPRASALKTEPFLFACDRELGVGSFNERDQGGVSSCIKSILAAV